MEEVVTYKMEEDGIAVITIYNPPVNAMTSQAWGQLEQIFYELETKEELRAVVLTARLEKNLFVGGSNIKDFLALDSERGIRYTLRNNNARFRVYNCPVPVICALNGTAIGGGLGLALMCDYRIAPPEAKFAVGEINMGILGFTQFLARRVHNGTARKMVYTGARLTAEEAKQVGLIDEVVPKEEVLETAMKLARQIARQSPMAVRFGKLCMLKAEEEIFREGGQELEDSFEKQLWGTYDEKEAVRAFLEKRDPVFRNC